MIDNGNTKVSNKNQIASRIRKVNYQDEISCSLLEEQIMRNCGICSLKKICDEIDNVSVELKERTTKAVKMLN